MADTQWGADDETPVKRKKGLPTWAWIGCGGCGLFLLLAVLGGAFVFDKVKKMADPEIQWPKVEEVCAVDERPDDWRLIMGLQFPQEQYTFQNMRTGGQSQLIRIPGERGQEARDEMFGSDEPQMPENLIVMKMTDFVSGGVSVQGRELRVLRYRMEFTGFLGDKIEEAEGSNPLGATCFIDITKDPGGAFTFWQLTPGGQDEPVSDDQIRAFLEPWHVGPERGALGDLMDAAGEALDQDGDGFPEALDEAEPAVGEDG